MSAVLDTVKAEIVEHQEAIATAMRERDELQAELEKREAAVAEHSEALKTLQEIEALAELAPQNGAPAPKRAAASPPRQRRRAPKSVRHGAGGGVASEPRSSRTKGSTVPADAPPPAPRPPSPFAPTRKTTANIDKVLDFIRRRGAVTSADIQGEFGLTPSSVSNYVGDLRHRGKIVEAGKRGRSTVLRPIGQVPRPEHAQREKTLQEPALEGRVLNLLCHKYLTAAQVAAELDAAPTDVDALIKKLEADGDVRRLSDGRYAGDA
ncbi:MAG TPA: hypothetical protein VK506_11580 [Conexibacter sp.]|nr:hypothetical protein [Conexibacter sp.]